ncbi:hypothetical protein ACLB2K_059795 [Fragaria x ananassa]
MSVLVTPYARSAPEVGQQHIPTVSLCNYFQVLLAERENDHREKIVADSSRDKRGDSNAILVSNDAELGKHNNIMVETNDEDSGLVESNYQTKFRWGDLENEEPFSLHTYTKNEMTGPLSSWYDEGESTLEDENLLISLPKS